MELVKTRSQNKGVGGGGGYTHWADYLVSCVLVKFLLKIRTKITEEGREEGRGEGRREADKREG